MDTEWCFDWSFNRLEIQNHGSIHFYGILILKDTPHIDEIIKDYISTNLFSITKSISNSLLIDQELYKLFASINKQKSYYNLQIFNI